LSAKELKKEEAQGNSVVAVGTGIEIKEAGLRSDEKRACFIQNKESIGPIASDKISFVSEISLIGGTSTEEKGE
jgi:hypothetical protein